MNSIAGVRGHAHGREWDRSVVFGAVLCLAVIVVGIFLAGNAMRFISPVGLLIVLGGTVAATMVHFSFYDLAQSREALIGVFFAKSNHAFDRIARFVSLAHSVRHNGLLTLEKEARYTKDSFLRKALEIAVDGQSPEELRRILETEIRAGNDQAGRAVQVFTTMGTYAPAMGLIGTLIGLMSMLGSLDNPATIGPAMAVALTTTLYGAILANLLFLPVAGKIRNRLEEELVVKLLTIEGVISLSKKENPIVIEQRLQSFLPLNHGL